MRKYVFYIFVLCLNSICVNAQKAGLVYHELHRPKVHFSPVLNLSFDQAKDFSLKISNRQGEELIIGYDKTQDKYFADRTRSGKVNFHKDFPSKNLHPGLQTVLK